MSLAIPIFFGGTAEVGLDITSEFWDFQIFGYLRKYQWKGSEGAQKKALFELPLKFSLSPINSGSMFWSVLAQPFPFPTIPGSSLGWKGWHLCAWCMPRWHQLVLPSAMLWAAWDSWGCPCSLQGGWNWVASTGPFWPKWFCCSVAHTFTALPALICHCPCGWFPFCTDSCFYTKIIKWVFLARQILLFCSWVTFVWSLLIPLPRSSDILSKKAWKHLTHMTFQGVFIYSACWHLLMPRNYFCMRQEQGSNSLPMQLLWLSAQIKRVCMQMARAAAAAVAWISICSEESHMQTQTKMCLCINIWPITKLSLQ